MIKRAVTVSYAIVGIAFLNNLFAAFLNTPHINKFGQTGIFYSHSAKTLGMGCLSIGTYGNVSSHNDFVVSVTDENDTSWSFRPHMTMSTMNYSIGYGITRYLDFSVMLPLYLEDISHKDSFGEEFVTGLGDLEISIMWQYPPYPHRKFFEMAYFLAMTAPTGDKDANAYFPRHAYYMLKDSLNRVKDFYTSGASEVDMKMIWTFDFKELFDGAPVEAHINYGVRWTDWRLDHLFLLNVGLEFRPANWIIMFTEFSGETRIANIDRGFKIGDDPLRLSPGITLAPPGGFYIKLGMEIDLSSDNTTLKYLADDKIIETEIEPQLKFAGSVGWAGFILPQDKDKDGIKDNDDRCPKDPEDYDGFEDTDGCPDYDNDADGVPDSSDKCPNEKEDVDGFEDKDGCPEVDNDKDGIMDADDKCPNVPEDADGFEDNDGCPDYDNDGDGIPDSVDHCINKKEDRDNFEDNDGCPDFDNDMDGIPDSLDKCPDKSETFNAFEDEDGCPDERAKEPEKPKAKEIKRGRVVLRGVNFEFGKATLTGDSYVILDQVYASLVEWPEVKVEIRGHTDSIGSRLSNKRLSYNRAMSVRNYLIQKGISPDRIIATGMGEDEPMADNKTAEGRAINRRVELHRID